MEAFDASEIRVVREISAHRGRNHAHRATYASFLQFMGDITDLYEDFLAIYQPPASRKRRRGYSLVRETAEQMSRLVIATGQDTSTGGSQ